jgi:plasmid stability protein
MNWITTNIRLPEDIYMELKISAAEQRKSVAAVVREKLGVKKVINSKEVIWNKLGKFASEMTKTNPGVSLSQKLVEMRYEQ